jgi:hypothetical protein
MADAQVVNIAVVTRPVSQNVVDTEAHAGDKDSAYAYASATPSLRAHGGEGSSATLATHVEQMSVSTPEDPRISGAIASPRGAVVLVITCTAQLLDLILYVTYMVCDLATDEETG